MKFFARAAVLLAIAAASALAWFLLLGLAGAGLIVAGVAILFGNGWALIVGGVVLLLGAAFVRKGMNG